MVGDGGYLGVGINSRIRRGEMFVGDQTHLGCEGEIKIGEVSMTKKVVNWMLQALTYGGEGK